MKYNNKNMNINGLFNGMKTASKSTEIEPNIDISTDISNFPIRDKSTLNQLLYKNEIHNKRSLPKNDDKKPLHEILVSKTISKSELDKIIDEDIENLKEKCWTQMPLKLRRELISDYCENHDLRIDESMILKILKDRSLVKYSRKNAQIEALKI